MNTPDTLFHIHRVPWQIEIEQDARKLQIQTFTASCSTNQNTRPILQAEFPFCRQLGSMIATTQNHHSLSWIRLFNLASN
jgi:hypothetical protein